MVEEFNSTAYYYLIPRPIIDLINTRYYYRYFSYNGHHISSKNEHTTLYRAQTIVHSTRLALGPQTDEQYQKSFYHSCNRCYHHLGDDGRDTALDHWSYLRLPLCNSDDRQWRLQSYISIIFNPICQPYLSSRTQIIGGKSLGSTWILGHTSSWLRVWCCQLLHHIWLLYLE